MVTVKDFFPQQGMLRPSAPERLGPGQEAAGRHGMIMMIEKKNKKAEPVLTRNSDLKSCLSRRTGDWGRTPN
jgi:hypothetical protein